jgi:ribonuclease T1
MNIAASHIAPQIAPQIARQLAAQALPVAVAAAETATAAEPRDQVVLSAAALAPPEGMEIVEERKLPETVAYTIDLIESGHRFHRRRNGITFHNREKLLPNQPEGYYTEWTVRERGQTGRKKSRIVAGQQGELYLTTNHYKSFRWVVPYPSEAKV